MNDHVLKQEIAKADKAINDRDFETVASCYTEEAVLVVKPGKLVQGREAIKAAHQKISDYFNGSLNVTQGNMVVIEAGDIALVLSKTYIESPEKTDSEFSSERDAIYIYQKSADGTWLCAIDNSYGVTLLESDTQPSA
ncbi:MAG: nuclear transport factor 2 family protein [Cyanobacteria bacterium J069]|nr:MAG: SgcJ/EcaC family oxidoreductase [Cyanobacteria bacterium J069]